MSDILPRPKTRAFDDIDAMRQNVYGNVQRAYSDFYPIENSQFRLELDDIGYDGFLTIEREVGDDPADDIAKAITFLKSFD